MNKMEYQSLPCQVPTRMLLFSSTGSIYFSDAIKLDT